MKAQIRLWWELLGRCRRHSPWRWYTVVACLMVQTCASVAIGLALRTVVNGSAADDATMVMLGAVGAACACVGEWAVNEVALSLRMHLVERVALNEVDSEVLRATVGLEGLEHLERPDYLDRITVVRGETWAIVDSAWSAVESLTYIIRLVLTMLLLGSVNPWLLLLLPAAAVPLWLNQYGRAGVREAEIRTAEDRRLERHFFDLCTSPVSAKEIQVTGTGGTLVGFQVKAWERSLLIRFRARIFSAAVTATGWGIFTLAFAVGLALVARGTAGHAASAGDLVLVVTVGSQLRGAVESAVQRSVQTGDYGRLLHPYLWLREYHARHKETTGQGVLPATTMRTGISLEGVNFTYPGTTRVALHNVTVRLPAGSVVAVVGEYGSGKSTLVKLLAKFYRPDSGRIRVDGVDLEELDSSAWRARMSAAFQDFGRYCTTLREAIGLGDPEHRNENARVAAAVRSAHAGDLVSRLPQRLDTQLGKEFGGIDLSEGQWQKVALARSCMRTEPLLFILDEPTASLDAPSERAIFEQYMARARAIAAGTGAVTVVVSHRFSTVAGADLILVMDNGRLTEVGDHASLMATGGTYAQLYSLQAEAYAKRETTPCPHSVIRTPPSTSESATLSVD
ncbi:ATP-binding cassette domain-containing protein [Streptomyces radiopugnans]|uniref:ATP-binding cassette domain-containing protein n=1 Tax=Streptomyces radiopugnans TaxID=403935 RepID=UPI003F1DC65D